MNVGGGEAADQMVRMMLSGTEVTVRLGASLLKNVLALTLALAKNNKTLSGKVNLSHMLKETRDLRLFPMTPEQYQQFKKRAVKQKILFSAARDTDGKGKLVDVILPTTELGRANQIFERILYVPPQERQERQPEKDRGVAASKKESRSERDSPDTKTKSSMPSQDEVTRTTNDKPSVEDKLKGYREQLQKQQKSAPAKARKRTKSRAK